MEKIIKTASIDRVHPDPILLPDVTIYGNKSCFQCNFCAQKGVKANVNVHQLTCNYRPIENPYSLFCEECSFIFYYLRAYKQHCDQNVRCKEAKLIYVCDVCNAFLASKASVDRHITNNSHESKYARKQKKEIAGHVKTIDFFLNSILSTTVSTNTSISSVAATSTISASATATAVDTSLIDTKPTSGKWVFSDINLYRPAPSDKDKIMVIVDTNILISEMYRIDAILYRYTKSDDLVLVLLPYQVLQELDKLKCQKGPKNVSCDAHAAAKAIYENFNQYPGKFKCQGALNHQRYLIEIDGPDDKILNFCLQVKPHAGHVILLSNDIIFKTKALGTAIECVEGRFIKDRLIELCGY